MSKGASGPRKSHGHPGVLPFPGIPVRTLSTIRPKPGQVIVRYAVVEPKTGCCACEDLSLLGWFSVGLAAVFFWPAMCIPCCIPACHDKYQIPIYGDPSEIPRGSYVSPSTAPPGPPPGPPGVTATGYPVSTGPPPKV